MQTSLEAEQLSLHGRAHTWGAGAAEVQGVVQLAHCILQNGLRFGGCTSQYRKLFIQQLLPKPLLLRLLMGGGGTFRPRGPGLSSKD